MNAEELLASISARYWMLAEDEAIELGDSKKVIDDCHRKAHYWLDRLNELKGKRDNEAEAK
jgi:hypothetical protein